MSILPRKWLALPIAALALAAAGCGGDDETNDEQAATTAPTTAETTTAAEPDKPAPEEAPAGDPGGEDAVKQAVLDYTFKADCNTMTDKFLDTQAFSGETREEKCDFLEKTFQKPQYSEDDVKFRKVEIKGDKATVTIGSDLANIQTDYLMVAEGGQWRIDDFDIK